MKRTAIYIRVSTERQAQEGDSISAQRDALMRYIDNHDDMRFSGEYLDDGISGTKFDRTEFQRLLSDVQSGKLDVILVTKMDRLHRSLRNFLTMQDVLDKHNCNWIAIWEPIYDSSTPQGRMIINTMVNLAQFEAEQTGQRIRQVNSYKVSQGEVISGTTPIGYRIVDKHLVPDEMALHVKQVFEKYSYTGNLRQTALYAGSFDGFPKTPQGIKYLLRNEKYAGMYHGKQGFCQAIIEKALFDDVQRKLNMNIKISQKNTYIFSGLLTCGVCGSRMGGTGVCKKGVKKLKYRCVKYYTVPSHTCSNTKSLYETTLEKRLIANLKPWISQFIVDCEKKQNPAKAAKAQLDLIDRKLSRLKDLYVNDLISLDEYKQDKERFDQLIKELEKELTSEPSDLSMIKQYLDMDLESLYTDLSPEEKRYFWRSIFSRLTLNGDGSIGYEFMV